MPKKMLTSLHFYYNKISVRVSFTYKCIKLDTKNIFKLADKRSTSLTNRNVSYIAIYFKLVAMLIASSVNVPRLLIAKFNERLNLLV